MQLGRQGNSAPPALHNSSVWTTAQCCAERADHSVQVVGAGGWIAFGPESLEDDVARELPARRQQKREQQGKRPSSPESSLRDRAILVAQPEITEELSLQAHLILVVGFLLRSRGHCRSHRSGGGPQ